MNVNVNLEHTQVERILAVIGPEAHGDFGEVDGDHLIADRLIRALELAKAQEVERRATSDRIAAERRARIIATAADAEPLLDEIEDGINQIVQADLPLDQRARRGVDHMQTIKLVRKEIDYATKSGFDVVNAEATLARAEVLYQRVLTELLGVRA